MLMSQVINQSKYICFSTLTSLFSTTNKNTCWHLHLTYFLRQSSSKDYQEKIHRRERDAYMQVLVVQEISVLDAGSCELICELYQERV